MTPDVRRVVLLLGTVTLIGIALVRTWPQPAEDPVKRWQAEAAAAMAQTQVAEAKAAEWRAQATQAQAEADRFQRQAQVAGAKALLAEERVAVTRAALAAAVTQADSVPVMGRLIAQQDTVIGTLKSQVAQEQAASGRLREAVASVEAANAVLQADMGVLRGVLADAQRVVPQRCRIVGLIPCPSRTTTFVAGALTGAALSVALIR